jgi:hypothetical protein
VSGCVSNRLGDYLEGDLGVPARARVETHLAECARCREELRGLRATVALLRGLPKPPPSRDLTSAVMARLDAEPPRGWLRSALRELDAPGALGLLAAGLACLALVGLWQQGPLDPSGSVYTQAPERELARAPQETPRVTRFRWPRRPAVVSWSPAASAPSRQQIAAFSSGVAPLAGIAELPTAGTSQREIELDRQLQRLMVDPSGFLARMGPDVRGERFARLAQHAARRGDAAAVANRLIAVPHPLANDLAPRFLAASLAADFERGGSFR